MTCTSWAMLNSAQAAAAAFIVGQSESLPMMIPTTGFVEGVVFIISLVCIAITEVIEECHTICLCPDADLPGLTERVVLDVEQVLTVEADLEVVGLELDPQGMPLGRGHRLLDAVTALPVHDVQSSALALDRLVKHHIVFQRIGAAH